MLPLLQGEGWGDLKSSATACFCALGTLDRDIPRYMYLATLGLCIEKLFLKHLFKGRKAVHYAKFDIASMKPSVLQVFEEFTPA